MAKSMTLRSKLTWMTLITILALVALVVLMLNGERHQMLEDRQNKVRSLVEVA